MLLRLRAATSFLNCRQRVQRLKTPQQHAVKNIVRVGLHKRNIHEQILRPSVSRQSCVVVRHSSTRPPQETLQPQSVIGRHCELQHVMMSDPPWHSPATPKTMDTLCQRLTSVWVPGARQGQGGARMDLSALETNSKASGTASIP